MTEAEVRAVLERICRDLERGARATIRNVVVPGVVGLGLTLSSCSSDDPSATATEVEQVDGSVQTDVAADAAGPDDVAPIPNDLGVQPLYAAPQDVGPEPDDLGAQPLYAAPADVGPEDTGPDDLGAQPLYAAPDDVGPADAGVEDAGPTDAGAQPLYAGPDPDAGTQEDIGAVPLYGAPPPQDAS